ncbi:hypothetical protein HanPSC8_Chr16g0736151 [Helianthus annuus]|nr:hypothetical protein HanPSC8_Chr16g0736151 [Helianthus annuus]
MATIIHNPFSKPQSPTDRRRRSFMVSKLQKKLHCEAQIVHEDDNTMATCNTPKI